MTFVFLEFSLTVRDNDYNKKDCIRVKHVLSDFIFKKQEKCTNMTDLLLNFYISITDFGYYQFIHFQCFKVFFFFFQLCNDAFHSEMLRTMLQFQNQPPSVCVPVFYSKIGITSTSTFNLCPPALKMMPFKGTTSAKSRP